MNSPLTSLNGPGFSCCRSVCWPAPLSGIMHLQWREILQRVRSHLQRWSDGDLVDQEALRRGMTEKSAVTEHAWDNQHFINWKEASIIDRARMHEELLLKEALHIHMTPAYQRLNEMGVGGPGMLVGNAEETIGWGWLQPTRALRSCVC